MNGALLAVVGGGTGGHVYPGVAVAEAWRAAGGRVIYLGSEKGMEARVVPPLGIPFEAVPARRLKNAGVLERLKTLLSLPGALWTGRALLKRLDPAVVLGVGGYVSGPVVLAAALGRRPCAVAEQNARPGLTNRILSRFVSRVYGAFPEVADRLPKRKVRLLGNPVRDAIQAAALTAPEAGRGRHLLILGGSQGARALNRLLPGAVKRLRARFADLVVVHQTGRDKDAEVRDLYGDLLSADPAGVTVVPFIDDMASAIVAADLVVARAGATTVAELACIGRPALYVPFPQAADDHQAANAQAAVQAGAAAMEREEALTEDSLVAKLEALLTYPATLAEMGRKAKALGRPRAAADIAADLQALGGVA
jgi:UDP-N-acetylglucosamine--N-acetylmuramyl-(pentapeptide) pyrophosphoryl-undecaprenol N-acetylglucosamine transferase